MTNAGQENQEELMDESVVVAASTADGGRRYGRRLDDDPPAPPIWLTTFADVMGLMLTFFVMMFALSTPTPENWTDAASSLRNELARFNGPPLDRGIEDAINLSRIDYDDALNIKYLEALLKAMLAENGNLKNVRLIPQYGQLIVSLPQDLLFAAGDAAITEDGSRALYALGGMLSRIKNKVEIIGHADPRPVGEGNAKFDSNWDLSLARAANVAALLNKVGYQPEIDIRGLSSGRYDDLSAIKDETERMDLSRRVDIVILNHDGKKRTPLFNIGPP